MLKDDSRAHATATEVCAVTDGDSDVFALLKRWSGSGKADEGEYADDRMHIVDLGT